MKITRKKILSHIAKTTYQPGKMKELAKTMGVTQADYREFRQLVRSLVREGVLMRGRHSRYMQPSTINQVVGRLKVHIRGFGLLARSGDSTDVFIPARDLDEAIDGDLVRVALTGASSRRGEPLGRVAEIVEQVQGEFLGTYRVRGGRHLVSTITDGDIRRAMLNQTNLDQPIKALIKNTPSALRRGPITAVQGTTSADLIQTMSEFSIRHIPIVDLSGRVLEISLLSDLIQDTQLPVTAVVMAGGQGTRLRPLTENLPKPMLPVGEKPLMEIIISQLSKAGIKRVNLTTHFKSELIHDHFGDGRDFGVDIEYVDESQPLGTAGSLSLLDTLPSYSSCTTRQVAV